jgi:hypothetical protein
MNRIFVSATTGDLLSVRQHITNLVLRSECHPTVEEGFEALPDDVALAEYLNMKLRACSGMIHVAGLHYGGESARRSRGSPRRSWTQMEYYQAKRNGKRVLVCLADPEFYRRPPLETGNSSERKEKAALQRKHYDQLRDGKGFYYTFKRAADLTDTVMGFLQKFQQPQTASKVKVLYVAAEKDSGLDLKEQLRRLRRAVSPGAASSNIKIAALFNATATDIIERINREQPTILHIAGRQDAGIIQLHDRHGRLAPFDANKLAHALAATRSPSLRLVVLDTCHSMQQAKILTARGVGHAVGIYDYIVDNVATDFYTAFYSQLASGHDLRSAREAAYNAVVGALKADRKLRSELEVVLEMPFNPAVHIPTLSSSKGLDPSHEVFA